MASMLRGTEKRTGRLETTGVYLGQMSWWLSRLIHRRRRHSHTFMQVCEFEHAPVTGGYHTRFLVFHCACGAVDVFPSDNYRLTSPMFQKLFTAQLKATGRFLV